MGEKKVETIKEIMSESARKREERGLKIRGGE